MTEKIGVEAVFGIVEFNRGVSDYVTGISRAESATDRFSRSSLGYFDSVGRSAIKLGAIITGVLGGAFTILNTAIAGFGTTAVNEASKLEEQMDDIQAVLMTTEEAMVALRDSAIEIGLDPRLRASVFDAADVMEMLARNGVAATDILNGLTLQTIALANATGGEFTQAADIASDAMFLFGIRAEDFSTIANGVTAVVNNSKFDLNDYRYALANAGGVASQVGLSFADMNLILAETSIGFASGRTAGQSLKTFLQRLTPVSAQAGAAMQQLGLITFDTTGAIKFLNENGITPAGDSLEQLLPQMYAVAESLGFVTREGVEGEQQFRKFLDASQLLTNQFFDTNGQLKSAIEISTLLNESLEGLSAKDRNQLMFRAFGTDGIRTATLLSRASKEEMAALQKQLMATSALDSAAIRVSNLKGALQILEETVQAVQIAVGLQLLPTMTDFIKLITAFIESKSGEVTAFFQTLTAGVTEFVSSLQAGQSPLSAFLDGIGQILRELGYAGASVAALEATITRISSAISGVFASALALASSNVTAFSGALAGIVVALSASAALTTLISTITLLMTPIGQVMIVAGALGAAWATNFLGMQDAVNWLIEALAPAISAVVAFGVYVTGVVRQLVGEFVSGFTSIEGQVSASSNVIMQSLFSLGRVAAGWGAGLMEVIASGIMSAVGAIVTAINYIGSIIAYWMAPQSPPRFLPDLDTWGSDAASIYLEGWSDADFGALEDFGSSVAQILQSLVASGDLDEKDANPILLALRDQMANAVEELNRTGSVADSTFAAMAAAAGPAGEAVEAYARQYIELNQAIEAARLANERLTAATDEQAAAEEAFQDIKDRLESGDTTVTMDEIKAARERLKLAKTELDSAEEQAEVANDAQTAAQAELKLLEDRIGVQNETNTIYGQQLALLERLANAASERTKKEKEGLTALELQIKGMEMLMAHYRDRQRLAELDAIIADEESTAQEKATAELEKQLILLQMQQREVEAMELGIDLSKAYELPIVLEEAVKKGKELKGIDWADMAADIAGVPNFLSEMETGIQDLNTPANDVRMSFDKIKGSIKEATDSIAGLFTGGDLKIPFVEDINAFLDRLSQPITFPSIDFGAMAAPALFTTDIINAKAIVDATIESLKTEFDNRLSEAQTMFSHFLLHATLIKNVPGEMASHWYDTLIAPLVEQISKIGEIGEVRAFGARLVEAFRSTTDPIKEGISNWLKETIDSAINSVYQAIGGEGTFGGDDILQILFPGLFNAGVGAAGIAGFTEKIAGVFSDVYGKFIQFVNMLEPLWNNFTSAFERAREVATPIIQDLFNSLNKAWDKMGPLKVALDNLVKAFQPLWNILSQFTGHLPNQTQAFQDFFSIVSNFVSQLWEVLPIGEVLEAMAGAITIAFGVVVGIFQGLANALEPFLIMLGSIFTSVINIITGVVNTVTGLLELLVGVFTGNGELIQQGWERLNLAVTSIVQNIVNVVVSLITGLINTITYFIAGFVDGIVGYFQWLYDELVGHSIIPDMVNGIIEWFTTLGTRLWEIVNKVWVDVIAAFTGLYEGLIIVVEDTYNGVYGWFVTLGTDIFAEVNTMWSNVASAFETAKADLLGKVATLITSIITKFMTTDWASLGRDLVSDIAEAIKDNLGLIGDAARDLVSKLVQTAMSAIQNLLGGQQPAPAPVPGNAEGTNYWKGGPTWLGEKGYEALIKGNRMALAGLSGPTMANVAAGTRILDHDSTRALMAGIGLATRQRSGMSVPEGTRLAGGGGNQYDNRTYTTRNYQISTSSNPPQIEHALEVAEVMGR